MRYDTQEYLDKYLLFHYGQDQEQLPFSFGPYNALHFPVRYVTECVTVPQGKRALEVGCAVGRASFELSKHFNEVIGIDLSKMFITAAQTIQQEGSLNYTINDHLLTAKRPSESHPERMTFKCADAIAGIKDEKPFDVIVAANLLCRIEKPAQFLEIVSHLVLPKGQFILLTPYSWSTEFTPEKNWLTSNQVKEILKKSFHLSKCFEMPFLLREHYRHYQWGVSEAMVWNKD